MTIGCIGDEVAEQFCTPTCSRWTQINEGQPVRIYHDISGWDPTYYTFPIAIDAPDPTVYLTQAIAIWQQGYPCGQLFTLVDSLAEADVVVQYSVNTSGNTAIGSALCFCDADDDVCIRQVDHSAVWRPGNPAIMNIFCLPGAGFGSINSFINLYVHELGHILGMGHVSGLPVTSVMGIPANQNSELILYDFDRQQLEDRYPCGCTLVSFLTDFITPEQSHHTGDWCPGCQGSYFDTR